MSATSNTFLFNNIYVNFEESTFDLNTNIFTQADQPKDCSTTTTTFPYTESSTTSTTTTVSDPINIPTPSTTSCINIYDPNFQQQDQLQPTSSPFINNDSLHLYSPISTSDDSFCFSPTADSDFLSASASSPASSSLGSYMANETFLNTTSCTDQLFNQHDFCLNDSLSGSQQDYHHASLQAAFTIPALQVQPEEDTFLPTPVPSNASTPPSFQQDYTTMFMATSPALSMDSSIMMNYSSFPTEQSPHYSYHDLHHQQQPTTITTTTRRSHGTRRRTPKVHQCPHCPHTSNRANNMKEHILTHDPNRPKKFPCPKCGKRFARKHDMKRHSKSPHH